MRVKRIAISLQRIVIKHRFTVSWHSPAQRTNHRSNLSKT